MCHPLPEGGTLGGEDHVPVHMLGDEEEDEGLIDEYGAIGDEREQGPGVPVVYQR